MTAAAGQAPSPGSAGPGVALLLERGGARLVASARDVGGARLVACELAVRGAERPRSVADCRGRVGAVTRLHVEVPGAALLEWLVARLVGAWVGGWRVGQVRWDRSEGTGDAWAWMLTGTVGAEEVCMRVELGVRVDGGRLVVRPRRCWLLGPPAVTTGRTWAALVRRLVGSGVTRVGDGLVIDVARVVVGPGFAAAGWRMPGAAEHVAVRARGEGFELRGGVEAGWPEGQVEESCPEGQVEDVLLDVRAGLRGAVVERALACERLRALATELPALAGPMARARVVALRFVDRVGCVAALRGLLKVEPDAEAWWLLAVQSRGAVDGLALALAGLAGLPASDVVRAGRVLAQAQALGRVAGKAAEARALLEPWATGETSAAVWRSLARLRAADPSARAAEVEAALVAALGEDGWRHRGEAGDLRGAVAEAVVRSGRTEASTAALLQRILVGAGRRGKTAGRGDGAIAGLRRSTQILADYYAQEGRWREVVALLERELGRLGEAARGEAVLRIQRIQRHYLPELDGERAPETC